MTAIATFASLQGGEVAPIVALFQGDDMPLARFLSCQLNCVFADYLKGW